MTSTDSSWPRVPGSVAVGGREGDNEGGGRGREAAEGWTRAPPLASPLRAFGAGPERTARFGGGKPRFDATGGAGLGDEGLPRGGGNEGELVRPGGRFVDLGGGGGIDRAAPPLLADRVLRACFFVDDSSAMAAGGGYHAMRLSEPSSHGQSAGQWEVKEPWRVTSSAELEFAPSRPAATCYHAACREPNSACSSRRTGNRPGAWAR